MKSSAPIVPIAVSTAIVTSILQWLLQPSWELISSVIFPSSFANTAIATLVVTVLAVVSMIFFHRPNPEVVSVRPGLYYLLQPGLEEVLLRYNILLLMKDSGIDALWAIIVIALLQSYIFAVRHNVRAFPSILFSGFVFLVAGYYYGMVPAIIAHTISNSLLRLKILNEIKNK